MLLAISHKAKVLMSISVLSSDRQVFLTKSEILVTLAAHKITTFVTYKNKCM